MRLNGATMSVAPASPASIGKRTDTAEESYRRKQTNSLVRIGQNLKGCALERGARPLITTCPSIHVQRRSYGAGSGKDPAKKKLFRTFLSVYNRWRNGSAGKVRTRLRDRPWRNGDRLSRRRYCLRPRSGYQDNLPERTGNPPGSAAVARAARSWRRCRTLFRSEEHTSEIQ